jgi:hypothetical protein
MKSANISTRVCRYTVDVDCGYAYDVHFMRVVVWQAGGGEVCFPELQRRSPRHTAGPFVLISAFLDPNFFVRLGLIASSCHILMLLFRAHVHHIWRVVVPHFLLPVPRLFAVVRVVLHQ